MEIELESHIRRWEEEKEETKGYRIELQKQVNVLTRIVAVGTGIVIASNFFAPLILKAIGISK